MANLFSVISSRILRPADALVALAAGLQFPLTLGVLAGAPGAGLRLVAVAVLLGIALGAGLIWAARRRRGPAQVRSAALARAHPGAADLARCDRLTGTLTREGLRAALSAAAPKPGTLAVIDVIGLGEINRREGIAHGDRLMRHVAAQLASDLRPGDLLARWGGDEFVVCLAGLGRAEAERVMQRLEDRLRAAPFATGINGSGSGIAVTIGVAKFAGLPGNVLSTAVREAEEEIHTLRQLRPRRVA